MSDRTASAAALSAPTAVDSKARKALWGAAIGYAMDGFDLLILGFMLRAISADLQLSQGQAASLVTATLVGAVLGGIGFGMLSDRIGRRTSMMLFGALGALTTVPILITLQHVTSPWAAFGLIVLALAIVSFYTSISGIVKAEMFPPQVRALGVGLAYAIGNAIFGGSAEYAALGLKSLGHEQLFFWYVTVMMVVAFLVSLRLPRQARYLHHDH